MSTCHGLVDTEHSLDHLVLNAKVILFKHLLYHFLHLVPIRQLGRGYFRKDVFADVLENLDVNEEKFG